MGGEFSGVGLRGVGATDARAARAMTNLLGNVGRAPRSIHDVAPILVDRELRSSARRCPPPRGADRTIFLRLRPWGEGPACVGLDDSGEVAAEPARLSSAERAISVRWGEAVGVETGVARAVACAGLGAGVRGPSSSVAGGAAAKGVTDTSGGVIGVVGMTVTVGSGGAMDSWLALAMVVI